MKIKLYNYITYIILLICIPKLASAQSLTGNVGSANIIAGEQGIEYRIGTDIDGSLASRFHYDYAFNNWYQLRIIGAFTQKSGKSFAYDSVTFENWFQWREERNDNSSFNGGLRFAYGVSDSGPDEAELRLTVTDRFADNWEWRANLIAEMEAGRESIGGVALEARAQITNAVDFSALGTRKWRFGTELFAEFGNSTNIPRINDQAYQIGPVLKVAWGNGVYLQSAVRFGVVRGADNQMFKLFVGKAF